MSMNRIDGQRALPSRTLDSSAQAQLRKEAMNRSGAYEGDAAPQRSTATGDEAVISDKAQQLMEMRRTYEVGLAAVAREPNLREEKLAQVRARLEEGYYESPQVRERISEGVLRAIEGTEEA